jgi:hypothetical protein
VLIGNLGKDNRNTSPAPQSQMALRQDDTLSISKRRSRPRPMSSQKLSASKSMSVLSPTVEEPVIEERDGLLRPSIANEGIRGASGNDQGGPANSIDISQRLDAQDYEKHIKTDYGKIPVMTTNLKDRPVEKDRGQFESKVAPGHVNVTPRISKEFQSSGRDNSASYFGQRGTDKKQTSSKMPAVHSERAPPTSPFWNKKLNQLQTPSKALPDRSETDQVMPNVSLNVPTGIVSNRLRKIVASDPGEEAPSAFRALLTTGSIKPPQHDRKSRVDASSSLISGGPIKDPLARISHEEDMASLASLAEVIQSQDEIAEHDPPSRNGSLDPSETPKIAEATVQSQALPAFHSDLRSADIQSPEAQLVIPINDVSESKPVSRTSSDLPANADRAPLTPRRPATDSSIPVRGVGNSVKALAARFNNPDGIAKQSPSPAKTPQTQRPYPPRSAVVSPYMMNNSSAQKSQKSAASDKSFQAIRTSFPANRYGARSPRRSMDTPSPRLAKSPVPARAALRQEEQGPPRWPKLRPILKDAQSNKILPKSIDSVGPAQISSTLHLAGDGNVSLNASRVQSPTTVMPDQDVLPLDEHLPCRGPLDSRPFSLSSPFEAKSLSPDPSTTVLHTLCSVSPPEKRPDTRRPSILYSQIRNLQRELRVKTEEADQLREHLPTEVRFSDWSTVMKQLTQAKSEVETWRRRAEAAERMLELLGHPALRNSVDDKKCQTVTSVEVGNDGCFEGGKAFDDRIKRKKTRQESESAQSEHGLGNSEGTVRHTTPKYVFLCEDDLDSFREAEQAFHRRARPRTFDGPYELP